MKKVLLFLLSITIVNITLFSSTYAAVCDEKFNGGMLRYGKSYPFYDTWNNNGTATDYLNTFDVDYTQGASWNTGSSASWNYLDAGSPFDFSSQLKSAGYAVAGNSSMKVIDTLPTNWRIQEHPSVRTQGKIGSYDFGLRYTITYDNSNNWPNTNDDVTHTECVYYSVSWCGDGVKDSAFEVCDPNDISKSGWGNGGCDNSCQPITVNPPATCDGLTASPIAGEAPFTTTLTCSGTNVDSYKIQCGNGQVINAKTGTCTYLSGSDYTAQCIINNNITSNECKTIVKVTNPTPLISIDKVDANQDDIDAVIGNDTQTVTISSEAVFKIRVTNSGNESLKSLKVVDTISPLCSGNVTLPGIYPSSWSNFKVGGLGNHTNSVLDIGEWYEYTCEKGNTQSKYINEATTSGVGVISSTVVTDFDDTQVLLRAPSIQVVKTDSNPNDIDAIQGNDTQTVEKNDSAFFLITVVNNGTEGLKNIILTDTLAGACDSNGSYVNLSGKSFVNKDAATINILVSGSGNHSDDILQVGEKFSYTCEKSNTQSNYTNIVDVSGTGVNSGLTVIDDDPTNVIIKGAGNIYDLALRKTLSTSTPGPFNSGSIVTFDITVYNQGNIDSGTIEIIDYIPTGLTFIGGNGWTQSGNIITQSISNISQGANSKVTVSFTVNTDALNSITNYAEISKDNGNDCDSTPDNINGNQTGEKIATGMENNDIGGQCDTANEDEDDHDLETIVINETPSQVVLTKELASGQAAIVEPGDTVKYTITVKNKGTTAATNLIVEDVFPAELTLIDSNWTLDTTRTRVAVYNTQIVSLAGGAQQEINISFTVNSGAKGSILNLAIVCDADEVSGECDEPEVCDPETEDCCAESDENGDDDGCEPVYIPSIKINKLDANPNLDQDLVDGNDTQKVDKAEKAVFSIRVTNDGPVSLDTLILTDARAPNCAGSVTLPNALSSWITFTTGGVGNKADAILEPGEWFEYTCEKPDTQSDYTNTAGVTAEAVGTDIQVSDSDTTVVIISTITSSSSSGGTYKCESASQSGSVVTCKGNSKVDSFYLKCGSNVIGPKDSTSILGQHQATFNCNEDTYQCYVYDKDVSKIDGYSWRTSSACLVSGSSSSGGGGHCGNGIIEIDKGEQCDFGSANNGKADSLCTSTCQIKACNTTGASCVSSIPNGGNMIFGIISKPIIGHLGQALIEKELTFTNDSDHDMIYDKLCIKNTSGESALIGGEYCADIAGDVIYAYEQIKFTDYSSKELSYIGNKDGVVGADFTDAILTPTIETNGIKYYNAYFSKDSQKTVRVAKPAVVTTGGGTSYVKSTTSSDVSKVTKGSAGNTNFVGVSASSDGTGISSNVESINNTDTAVNAITAEKETYEESVEGSSLNTTNVVSGTLEKYNGLSNVFIMKDANLKTSDITGLGSITEARTYIIENGNLIVDSENLEANKNIAFVVRNGNIIIKNNVRNMDGTYIVLGNGKIIADESGTQLIVNGSLYGNIDELVENRYYISDDSSGQLSVGTIVSFGSSLFSKPAPLVSQFVGEYLESEKVAK